ncbi:MAG: peptidase M50 [Actinomycetia bacterium]|nr:peptidase M50 [Actinomycetes bacterium]MCH9760032.1 peptidase M50 [Actinomycetes bacterium]
MDPQPVAVLLFGGRRAPWGLGALPVIDPKAVHDPACPDFPIGPIGYRRIIVVGTHADLAAVLTRLLRTERLDIEVAHVTRRWQGRCARIGAATRVPLIRDETGSVVTRVAYWLPQEGSPTIRGEAVVDDTVLFNGAVTGVRIEPTAAVPGLRASTRSGRMRPRRWVTGRAAQLGTTGALVIRDGNPAPRPIRRSTFYRHTEGWLRVGL